MKTSTVEITLPALQGSSLLGFMAALGTLHTLASLSGKKGYRMRWVPHGSSFSPVLQGPPELTIETLLTILDSTLRSYAGHRVITIAKDLKIPCLKFRALANEVVDSFLAHTDNYGAAMAAAFGCDAIGNDDGNIKDTSFRTMSGAGHQHFLEFMNLLVRETTPEHLREALCGPWRYRDPSPIMRWDAEDDRRYALRWDEPSKDPVRTVRGANRLAIASLPLFPVVPVSSHMTTTTGFTGRKSNDTFFTWPLWSCCLGVDSVRSLLASADVQRCASNAMELSARGILAIFRTQRITLGKFRNFTPARAL